MTEARFNKLVEAMELWINRVHGAGGPGGIGTNLLDASLRKQVAKMMAVSASGAFDSAVAVGDAWFEGAGGKG